MNKGEEIGTTSWSLLNWLRLRRSTIWILSLQALVLHSSFAVWLLDIRDPLFVQGVYIASMLALAIYALFYVPLPSFFHYFVASYVLLFMLFPLASPWLRLGFFSDEAMGTYTAMTVGGIHIYVCAYELGRRRFEAMESIQLQPTRLGIAVWSILALNLAAIALVVLDAGSLAALASASRVERKLSFDRISLLIVFILNFGSVIYALLPIYLQRKKWSALPIGAALVIVEIGAFLAFRARSTMVNHMVAFAVGAVYLLPAYRQDPDAAASIGRSWRRTLALVALGLVVLSSAITLRFFRGTFEEAGLDGASRLVVTEMVRRSFANGDLGYTPNTLAVMSEVPRRRDYLYGQSYYRLLFIPIPRRIWPDKPENTQRVVAKWISPELVEQTVPPGVQGDLYINFGVWGTIGFALYGFVFAWFDRQRGLFQGLLVAAGFMPTFHLARGALTNPLVLLAAIAASAWALARYVGRSDGSPNA